MQVWGAEILPRPSLAHNQITAAPPPPSQLTSTQKGSAGNLSPPLITPYTPLALLTLQLWLLLFPLLLNWECDAPSGCIFTKRIFRNFFSFYRRYKSNTFIMHKMHQNHIPFLLSSIWVVYILFFYAENNKDAIQDAFMILILWRYALECHYTLSIHIVHNTSFIMYVCSKC